MANSRWVRVDDRLDSWKEIAAYLKRGLRTVQRWERVAGLPVRRLASPRGAVYSFKGELDRWWRAQPPEPPARLEDARSLPTPASDAVHPGSVALDTLAPHQQPSMRVRSSISHPMDVVHYATTLDGVRIAYMSIGDGPPLVFASNIFGDLTGYRTGWPHIKEITDRLVKLGRRVVRYDVRGMGYSDRNVADIGIAGRVLDVQAVAAQLGLEQFAVAGLDIGAATAMSYAAANQAKVSHLVLLSPWSSGAKYLGIPTLRAAYSAENVSNRDPKLFANVLSSVATSFQDAELVRLRTEWHLNGASPDDLVAYNAANERIDLTDLLAKVSMPTLVIHEPAFPFGSFGLCQEVAAGIRGAEFLIVNDQSITGRIHDETVAGIDRFLGSNATDATSSHITSEASDPGRPALSGLTVREVQILRQVAAGSTNKEIAREFGLAVSTVERHLVNLYTKIGARGRADAIAFAFRHRL